MFETIVKKIKQDMSDTEVKKLIRSERVAFNKEIDTLSNRIKDGERIEDVICAIHNELTSHVLINIVENEIKNETISFIESEHIRSLELSGFCELIKYSLDNIIINKESERVVAEHLQLDRKSFGYLVKFMNTINDLIVVKRFTKNNFSIAMFDLFRLDTDKINYIWQLFEDNKAQLINASLLSTIATIRRINNNIDFLNDLLANLDNE